MYAFFLFVNIPAIKKDNTILFRWKRYYHNDTQKLILFFQNTFFKQNICYMSYPFKNYKQAICMQSNIQFYLHIQYKKLLSSSFYRLVKVLKASLTLTKISRDDARVINDIPEIECRSGFAINATVTCTDGRIKYINVTRVLHYPTNRYLRKS